MTIYKPKSYIEAYRLKAKSKDINELTGRSGRTDLTKFIVNQILTKIKLNPDTVLVDIGCGDGMLLQEANQRGIDANIGKLVGILPTEEEVTRVKEYLLNEVKTIEYSISIQLGLMDKTNISDNYADIVVCNGVLIYAETVEKAIASVKELYRVTKKGGLVYIGEMPDSDEFEGRNYGDSIFEWLFWTIKNQGFMQFWFRVKQLGSVFVKNEPFIISPKKMFSIPPFEFIEILNSYGFQVKEYYKHKMIDIDGNEFDSKTRWNYIAVKS